VDVFPVATDANYSYERAWTSKHHGTDVFAARGTPVVAVAHGIARAAEDPKGGKVVYLAASDGWRYYYAHLDGWEPVLAEAGKLGMQVEPGTVLGYVGSSGNAVGKSPHLHFQLWTADGVVTDPYAFLREVDPRVSPGVQPPAPEPTPAPIAPASPAAKHKAKRPVVEAGGGALAILALLYIVSRLKKRRS
jgi:murein DD-endopeptidase MepM/ murein hydrolase activator NlpD